MIIAVISESDTTGVGTRTDRPLNLPARLGIVRAAALDAPVVVGTIFSAAERASRKSFAGASRILCEPVYECTVVIMAFSIPNSSSSTFIIGAIQLVVQEAFDNISSSSVTISSFTPITIVLAPSPFAGAEITTRLAPASICFAASAGLVKKPVDSITVSTPKSAQGNLAGSFSAKIGISCLSTMMDFSV